MSKEKNKELKEDDLQIKKEEFFESLKEYIFSNYEPVEKYTPNCISLSTGEIFRNLQLIFPSRIYKPQDISIWMQEKGFKYEETGIMRFEWIMVKRENPIKL